MRKTITELNCNNPRNWLECENILKVFPLSLTLFSGYIALEKCVFSADHFCHNHQIPLVARRIHLDIQRLFIGDLSLEEVRGSKNEVDEAIRKIDENFDYDTLELRNKNEYLSARDSFMSLRYYLLCLHEHVRKKKRKRSSRIDYLMGSISYACFSCVHASLNGDKEHSIKLEARWLADWWLTVRKRFSVANLDFSFD